MRVDYKLSCVGFVSHVHLKGTRSSIAAGCSMSRQVSEHPRLRACHSDLVLSRDQHGSVQDSAMPNHYRSPLSRT